MSDTPLSTDVMKLLDRVREQIRGYADGDRPPSPPAYLLRLERDLMAAVAEMGRKVFESHG